MPTDVPTSFKVNKSELIQLERKEELLNPMLTRIREKKKKQIDQMIREVHDKHNQNQWEHQLQKVPSIQFEDGSSLESDEEDGTDPDSKEDGDISNPLASSKNSQS